MRIDRVAVTTVTAGLCCAVAVVFAAGDVYGLLGASDPGRVTSLLVAAARFAANASGLVTVGALAFAAFVVPARRDTGLAADAFAAVRLAAGAASVWAVAAVAMVPLSAADAAGQPVGRALSALPALVDATEEPKAWLCVVAVSVAVAAGARATLTWTPVVLSFAVSVVGPARAGGRDRPAQPARRRSRDVPVLHARGRQQPAAARLPPDRLTETEPGEAHLMARKSPPIIRRRPSANVVITVAIVVVAVLVIGGILLFDRSDDTGGSSGEIPRELSASAGGNTLTEATGNTVTVVEFLDYQCPACAAYYQNVTRELETDYAGKITFVTRNFPLGSHPLAQPAARAAEAAAEQGRYREMYHALYDNYEQWALTDDGRHLSEDLRRATTLFNQYATDIGLDVARFRADVAAPAVRERIDADLAAGERVGVSSTPTIFVNGTKFEPAGDQFPDVDRELRDLIDEQLG